MFVVLLGERFELNICDRILVDRTINHCCGVIMGAMVSQITSLTIVYSTVHSGAYERKHQNTASLAFVRGIHRWPVNSSHKWPVTQKIFPFDDVIMCCTYALVSSSLLVVHLHISNRGLLGRLSPDCYPFIITYFSENTTDYIRWIISDNRCPECIPAQQ